VIEFQNLRCTVICLCFFCSTFFFSQTGNYFIRNYSPKEYNAGANNFGITQNDEGYIFIANDNWVIIYDGVNWQECKRDDEQTIFSIAKTQAGQIVAGTKDGDIAVIEKSAKGPFRYRSLLKNVPPGQHPREPIRQIVVHGDRTYFLSSDRLVEYDGKNFKFFFPEEAFHTRAYVMGDHLYVWDLNRGVFYLQNGKMVKVPDSENLSGLKFFFCYRINASKYALGCREDGIYTAMTDPMHPDSIRFKKIDNAYESELAQAEINNGCLMRNGQFVITTNKKGALLLDSNLKILNRFNVGYGIYDDNIKACYEDLNGNIWFSLFYGISFIEINSRVRKYDRNNGINGTVQSAAFYENKLFIATDKGVQYFDSLIQKFVQLINFNKQSWYLCTFGKKLLIGTDKGLFSYSDNLVTQLNDSPTFFLTTDANNSNMLYCGTDLGQDIYTFSGGKIQLLRSLALNTRVRSIASNKSGIIAMSSENNCIYILDNSSSLKPDSITEKEGLPDRYSEKYIFSYGKDLLVGTDSGVYVIRHSKSGYFCERYAALWEITKKSEVFRAVEADGDIICSQKDLARENKSIVERISYFNNVSGAFSWNRGVTHRLKDITPNAIIYDANRKISLVCCNEGLFVIDNRMAIQKKVFHLFIKELIAGKDTLGANISLLSDSSAGFEIPYSDNIIKMSLGFSSYESPFSEFSYKLEDRDTDFSKWTKETKIQFHNLFEGDYTIVVRARSEISAEIFLLKIKITILPPWYRSVWAYILYALLFIIVVYSVVQLNVKRLIAKNKKLEEVITERTRVIADQKGELEHKQKEIIDSIHYAQRIQKALLASDELLSASLNEYFVLFKPKDIVSGDFYWATSTPEGFLYITADCTGHGVPGAFMSLLNISKLYETVTQKCIQRPDLILNEVRNEIIAALNPQGSKEESKDGMDAVLCLIDHTSMKLQYASANNAFYIIRNKQLILCKADKMPVGKGHDNAPYTYNEIALQKGDMIFTFTDGYADQFGGSKGKKFKYKQMEEIMVSIADLSLAEQKKILDQRFEEWRGTLEQVDDVCVIGVRV
jgi:serine phosphatase RsbU (regulator of sigma subunit)/ligand-binding sensor domain-containing protein